MNFTEKCECCSHIKTAYTHRLSSWLVQWLWKLYVFYRRTRTRAKLQKDLNLTKNQYNNFQKLQYFWLVHRSSDWRMITKYWSDFITWEVRCWDTVATMWKKILPRDHEAWQTHTKVAKKVFIDQVCETTYKQAIEYKREKWINTKSLFDI